MTDDWYHEHFFLCLFIEKDHQIIEIHGWPIFSWQMSVALMIVFFALILGICNTGFEK